MIGILLVGLAGIAAIALAPAIIRSRSRSRVVRLLNLGKSPESIADDNAVGVWIVRGVGLVLVLLSLYSMFLRFVRG